MNNYDTQIKMELDPSGSGRLNNHTILELRYSF